MKNQQWNMEKLSPSPTSRQSTKTKGELSVSKVKAKQRKFNSGKGIWKYAALFKALYYVSSGQEGKIKSLQDLIEIKSTVIQTLSQKHKYTETLLTQKSEFNDEGTY